MIPEKWESIVGHIKDNFSVLEHEKFSSADDGGTEIEHIIFDGPLGRMKLEFIIRPIVLDKKTVFSRRVGSETKVEYVYSPDEKSYRLVPYKWDEDADDWREIDLKNFNLA